VRPRNPEPTDTSSTLPVLRTWFPSLKELPVAKDHRTDVVFLEVQGQGGLRLPSPFRYDVQHFTGHRIGEAIDTGNPVLDLENLTYLLGMEILLVILDGVEKNALDLTCTELGVRVGHWYSVP
jgi:hypothetical protein